MLPMREAVLLAMAIVLAGEGDGVAEQDPWLVHIFYFFLFPGELTQIGG
jgi:hypothetical protein